MRICIACGMPMNSVSEVAMNDTAKEYCVHLTASFTVIIALLRTLSRHFIVLDAVVVKCNFSLRVIAVQKEYCHVRALIQKLKTALVNQGGNNPAFLYSQSFLCNQRPACIRAAALARTASGSTLTLATPVSIATLATAAATAGATRGSNASTTTKSSLSSFSEVRSAMA